MLSITGSAIVFGSTCVLLMIGVQVQKQSLMIPYLIFQMLMIVMTAIVGIPIAIGLFYVKHPLYGLSVTTAVFFTSILPIYFWFTVTSLICSSLILRCVSQYSIGRLIFRLRRESETFSSGHHLSYLV